jgi:hypothetical protein
MERVAVVDVVLLLLVAVYLLGRGLRITLVPALYFLALVIAFGIGFMRPMPLQVESNASVAQFLALSVSLVYLIVGYNLAKSQVLLRALVLGVAAGVCWQSVIAVHDFIFPSQWFPDLMDGRVRGTFRGSGQLGTYGFSAAGILLTIGWSAMGKGWKRTFVCLMGVMALVIVVMASRRSAIISVGVWWTAFLMLGLLEARVRPYRRVLFATAIAAVVLVQAAPKIQASFFATRMTAAVASLDGGESFTERQARYAFEAAEKWVPLGVGLGRAKDILPKNEFHNAHLALAVEGGILRHGSDLEYLRSAKKSDAAYDVCSSRTGEPLAKGSAPGQPGQAPGQ